MRKVKRTMREREVVFLRREGKGKGHKKKRMGLEKGEENVKKTGMEWGGGLLENGYVLHMSPQYCELRPTNG